MTVYRGVSGIWFANCHHCGVFGAAGTRAEADALADQHARDCGHIGGGR